MRISKVNGNNTQTKLKIFKNYYKSVTKNWAIRRIKYGKNGRRQKGDLVNAK